MIYICTVQLKQIKLKDMKTLDQYEEIANMMLVEQNLTEWKFVWNNRTSNKTWGICKYTPKEIHLNKKYALIESEENVIDTIIHEVAHALTKGDNHGEIWKAKCRELGCRDEQFKDLGKESLNKLAKYKGVCPTCGHVIYSGRKTGIIHIECSNEEYRQTGDSNFKKHIYKWTNNI